MQLAKIQIWFGSREVHGVWTWLSTIAADNNYFYVRIYNSLFLALYQCC